MNNQALSFARTFANMGEPCEVIDDQIARAVGHVKVAPRMPQVTNEDRDIIRGLPSYREMVRLGVGGGKRENYVFRYLTNLNT